MNQLVETSPKLDVYFEGWHIKRVKRQVEKEIKSERDFKGQKTTTKEITTEVVKVEPKLVVSKRKQVKIEGWSDNSIPVHQLVEQLDNSKMSRIFVKSHLTLSDSAQQSIGKTVDEFDRE